MEGQLSQWVQDFDGDLDPKPDVCCWTCYLPTRVCKGSLADSGTCFSEWLLVCFWLVCGWSSRKSELLETPYFHRDWMPRAFNLQGFQEEGWQWDTEVIGGVVFFYRFSLQYFRMHGWD